MEGMSGKPRMTYLEEINRMDAIRKERGISAPTVESEPQPEVVSEEKEIAAPSAGSSSGDPVRDDQLQRVRERLGMPIAERPVELDETKLEEKSEFFLTRLRNPGLDIEQLRESAKRDDIDLYTATLFGAYDFFANELTNQWGGPERYTYKGHYNEMRNFDRTRVDEDMIFELQKLSSEMKKHNPQDP